MEYRKLTRLSAVFLILPGLAALLFPSFVWEALAGSSEGVPGGAEDLTLEVLRVFGALSVGSGLPGWLFVAEIEEPVEQRRAAHVQLYVVWALMLSFVHLAITTNLCAGVVFCLVWTSIPLVLNSYAILFSRGDTPPS